MYTLSHPPFALSGARKMVLVGDKLVDYNPEFRLFMSTRNPNPSLPPDVAAILTEVSYHIN